MRIKSARLGLPFIVGEEAADEDEAQSAPETVIWTDEMPSQTSETSSRRSLLAAKGRLAGTGMERGGGGGGRGGTGRGTLGTAHLTLWPTEGLAGSSGR